MKRLSEFVLIASLTGTFLLFTMILNQSQSNISNLTSIYKDNIVITK